MTVLAAIPSPTQGVWELGPCRSAPTPCASSPASSRRAAHREALGGPRRSAGRRARHRGLGGALRILGGRIYHVISSPPAYFGEGGDPLRRSPSGRAASASGARSRSVGSAPGSPAAVAASAAGVRRRGGPGLLVAQAIGRLGNWFNNELYGGRTDLPWALTIYEWNGGRRCSAPTVRRRRWARSTRRSSTRCCGTSPRPRWSSGPTAGSGSATAGPSRSTSRPTAPAGCGSSCCDRSGRDIFGVRLNVFTSIVVGLLRGRLHGVAARPAAGGHRPGGAAGPADDGATMSAGTPAGRTPTPAGGRRRP